MLLLLLHRLLQLQLQLWTRTIHRHQQDQSRIEGFTTEPKDCDEPRADLEAKGIDSKGVKKSLISKCRLADIPTDKVIPNVVQQGYEGCAIGAFQMLWERGMVLPDKKDQKLYSMKGKTDEHGNIIKETSINWLVRQCEDFVHEKTLLQYYGEMLGSIMDRSPKCTPELAGDGVEFDWGMSKLWYRLQPWESKKKKDKFKILVEEALSDKVLSLERTRHFSRRARTNMISYYMLEKDAKASTPSDVKKFKQNRKSHTCVLDEDFGFFSAEVKRLINQSKK